MAKKNNKFSQLAQRLQTHPTMIESIAEDAMERALDDGVEWMKLVIDNSGTGWVGRGPMASPESRNDYGYMKDAVDRTPVHYEGRTLAGKLGWVYEEEDYFGLQDQGFKHFSGKYVEGMNALAQGMAFARETLEAELRKRL